MDGLIGGLYYPSSGHLSGQRTPEWSVWSKFLFFVSRSTADRDTRQSKCTNKNESGISEACKLMIMTGAERFITEPVPELTMEEFPGVHHSASNQTNPPPRSHRRRTCCKS